MFCHRKTFAALLLGALLAAPAAAETLILKDGSRLVGRATAYDSASGVLTWAAEGGDTRAVALDEMRPSTAYRVLKGQVSEGSGEGELQLANFARDIGYFSHAKRHYDRALEADPDLADRVAAETEVLASRAAAWAMGRAREAIARKDLAEAEQWLHDLIEKLPRTAEAAEARRMIAEYHDRVRDERTAEADRQHREVLEQGLASGKKAYDAMVEANEAALRDARGGSRAVKSWERGLREGEKAMRELERFEKRNPTGYEDLIPTYRAAIGEQLVEIHLHLATHWATRNSYNKALAHCNQALALDGDDEEAKHLRNRIIDAASRGARWIW